MKQKTRFKNFGNIGYRSMKSRYIGIDIGHISRSLSQKIISVDLYYLVHTCEYS